MSDKQVLRQWLIDHTDLNESQCDISSEDEAAFARLASRISQFQQPPKIESPEVPRSVSGSQNERSRAVTVVEPVAVEAALRQGLTVQKKSELVVYRRPIQKRIWVTSAAALVCFCVLGAYNAGTNAVSAGQKALNSVTIEQADGSIRYSRDTKINVESLISDIERWKMFLPPKERQEANEVAKRLMVAQARIEFLSNSLADIPYNEEDSLALRLSRGALELAVEQGDPPNEIASILFMQAEGQFAFGVSRRGTDNREAERIFFDCAISCCRAIIELRKAQNPDSLRIAQYGSLLAKAVHKGAFRGEEQLVVLKRIRSATLTDRIEKCFPELDECDTSLLIRNLCAVLLAIPELSNATPDAHFVAAQVYNTYGLHLKNVWDRQQVESAIELLQRGVERIASINGEMRSAQVNTLHATLWGNIADAYLTLGDLDAQVESGRKAWMILVVDLAGKEGDQDIKHELVRISSRLAIAEYRQSVRKGFVSRTLGNYTEEVFRIKRMNDSLDFRGCQIDDLEILMISVLYAYTLDIQLPQAEFDSLLADSMQLVTNAMRSEDAEQNMHLLDLLGDFEGLEVFQKNRDFQEVVRQLRSQLSLEKE